jgi:hypothetical protein
MKGGEIKTKYAVVEEGRNMKYEITTGLFYQREHHILGLRARPCRSRHDILDALRKFQ